MRSNFKKRTLSMRGTHVDMDALRAMNEESPAIGNARMNARGDIMGQQGKIEVRREQIIQDYYKGKPQATQPVSLKSAKPDVFETPAEVMARMAAVANGETAVVDTSNELVDRKAARKLVDKED